MLSQENYAVPRRDARQVACAFADGTAIVQFNQESIAKKW